jgi:hypothetical protein
MDKNPSYSVFFPKVKGWGDNPGSINLQVDENPTCAGGGRLIKRGDQQQGQLQWAIPIT